MICRLSLLYRELIPSLSTLPDVNPFGATSDRAAVTKAHKSKPLELIDTNGGVKQVCGDGEAAGIH